MNRPSHSLISEFIIVFDSFNSSWKITDDDSNWRNKITALKAKWCFNACRKTSHWKLFSFSSLALPADIFLISSVFFLIYAGVLIASSPTRGAPIINESRSLVWLPFWAASSLFYVFPSINNFHSIRFRLAGFFVRFDMFLWCGQQLSISKTKLVTYSYVIDRIPSTDIKSRTLSSAVYLNYQKFQ